MATIPAETMITPFERLREEILQIEGVHERTSHGVYDHSFHLGRRMIAHVNGKKQLHLTLPKEEARELAAAGKVRLHSIARLAAAGHVVLHFSSEVQFELAIALVRRLAERTAIELREMAERNSHKSPSA